MYNSFRGTSNLWSTLLIRNKDNFEVTNWTRAILGLFWPVQQVISESSWNLPLGYQFSFQIHPSICTAERVFASSVIHKSYLFPNHAHLLRGSDDDLRSSVWFFSVTMCHTIPGVTLLARPFARALDVGNQNCSKQWIKTEENGRDPLTVKIISFLSLYNQISNKLSFCNSFSSFQVLI